MNFLSWIQNRPLQIWLSVSVLLLITYVASPEFREFLESKNIDPNFPIGFFTVIALLMNIIQSSHDKRYGYNLSLTTAIRSAGERVIAKTIAVKTKANLYHSVIYHLQEAVKKNAIFFDQNKVESKEDVEKDMESVAALIHVYFHEQGQKWNDTLDMLTEMANTTNNIYINYQIHAERLRGSTEHQRQQYLETLYQPLEKLKSLNDKITNMTEDLTNGIVTKINKMHGDFKGAFRFSL